MFHHQYGVPFQNACIWLTEGAVQESKPCNAIVVVAAEAVEIGCNCNKAPLSSMTNAARRTDKILIAPPNKSPTQRASLSKVSNVAMLADPIGLSPYLQTSLDVVRSSRGLTIAAGQPPCAVR